MEGVFRQARPDSTTGTAILFSPTTSLIGSVVAILFCVVGILTNTATLVALATNNKLRYHPTTLCILSLAVSDVIFSTFCLPITAHKFLHRGCEFMCLDYHLCKYYPFFFFGNIGVSLSIMTIIAIHRVFGIFYGHLLDKWFNQMSVCLMILTAWVFSFGSLLLPLTETWGQFGYEPQSFSCTLIESEGVTFLPTMAAVGVGVPCLVISTSYLAIYLRVKATGRYTRSVMETDGVNMSGHHNMVTQIKKRESSLTITFALIFISFLICYLPWALVTILDPLPPSTRGWLHMATYIPYWAGSSFLNPVIYCLSNKYYRTAYRQMIKRVKETTTRMTDLDSDTMIKLSSMEGREDS